MGERDYDYLPPGERYASPHSTPFVDKHLSELKNMVVYADPDQVKSVSGAWSTVHTDLTEGEDGGVLALLDALVNRLLQHWEGDAAEGFRRTTAELRQQIIGLATYAQYAAISVRGAANALQEYKTHIDAIEDTDDALADPAEISTQLAGATNAEQVLNAHRDTLSPAQRHRVEAAVVMERLGAAYASQMTVMSSWNRERASSPNYSGEPGGTVPVAEVLPVPYSVSLPHDVRPTLRVRGSATPSPTRSRSRVDVPPQIRTAVDGVSGGLRSAPHPLAHQPGTFLGHTRPALPGVVGGVPLPRPSRGGPYAAPRGSVVGVADGARTDRSTLVRRDGSVPRAVRNTLVARGPQPAPPSRPTRVSTPASGGAAPVSSRAQVGTFRRLRALWAGRWGSAR